MLNVFYVTIQYLGECGLIEGHAYSVLLLTITLRNASCSIQTYSSIYSLHQCTAVLTCVNLDIETGDYFLVLCSATFVLGIESKMAILS